MKQLRCCYFLLLAMLAGCAQLGLAPVSESKPTTPAEFAQQAINEANVTLTAVNNTIAQNAAAGVWTREEAQGYLDQSIDYGSRVDAAKALLDSGNIEDARTQAELLRSLIISLQRKVAEAARSQP